MTEGGRVVKAARPGLVATLLALIVFAILISLGVWQVQRLKWKTALLHRIAALQDSPAEPLYVALRRMKDGLDVEYVRVETDCAEPRPASRPIYVYGLKEGKIGWREVAPCRIGREGFDIIAVDRGFVALPADPQRPPASAPPPPERVVGILRRPEAASAFEPSASADAGFDAGFRSRAQALQALEKQTGARAAPMMLVAEQESPAPPHVTPIALPSNIPNNHLGYAITWFGLAAALAGVYLAVLLRKRSG